MININRSSMLFIFLPMLLLFAILLSACGGTAASSEPTPPTIHYGEDICEFCGMIISDERYAAGYVTQDGEERIFDDVGGMFQAHVQEQEDVAAFFVHDYEDVSWIRAENAHYVMSEDLATPMLVGVAACATAERAEGLADEVGGTVLTFDEVMTHYREHSAMADEFDMQQHDHEHHSH